MNKERKERIKTAISKRPYIFYFLGIFLAYVVLNLLINQTYVTFSILKSYALWFIVPFLFSNFLLVPFLVALTVSLSILRFKEAGFGFGKEGSVTGLGIFSGLLGGACPGCFVGLFPAFLGLFGITASLSSLPLFGFEIQILSAILLILAINLLTKDIVCEVPEGKLVKRRFK